MDRIKAKDVRDLLDKQQYRCALTGRHLTPDVAALDHIVPVGNGGKHSIVNVQVLHKDVNFAKGTMSQEAFISMCRDVVKHQGYFPK